MKTILVLVFMLSVGAVFTTYLVIQTKKQSDLNDKLYLECSKQLMLEQVMHNEEITTP